MQISEDVKKIINALAIVNFWSEERMMLELLNTWIKSEKDFIGDNSWLALESYVNTRLGENNGSNQINQA